MCPRSGTASALSAITVRRRGSIHKGDVQTFHEDGKWRDRIEGEGSLDGPYSTREEAVAAGREEAMRRKVEHLRPQRRRDHR
jgi:hypothetical protein